MAKKYKDEIARQVHKKAVRLFELGLIDTAALAEFDADCLVKPLVPCAVKIAGVPSVPKVALYKTRRVPVVPVAPGVPRQRRVAAGA
jgi:hypothetical protein